MGAGVILRGNMSLTLLGSNEHGALFGNDDGNAFFLDAYVLVRDGDSIRFRMPKVMSGGIGLVIPDLINFGPDRFIDFRKYISDAYGLMAIAAFDDEARIWIVRESPAVPSILRLH